VLRTGVSPRAAQASLRTVLEGDLRPLLPLIQVPTLVLHRRDFHVPSVEHTHFLVEHIPGAKLAELPGADMPVIWDTPELALDLIEEFLTGVRRIAEPKRVLATVVFTDIVSSTEQVSRLGDRRWRELLDVHDELARRVVEEFQGQLVKTTGDGSWPPSTVQTAGAAARLPSETSCAASGSRFGWDCTLARLSCVTAMSVALLFISRPG
jgi:hypothetical protein